MKKTCLLLFLCIIAGTLTLHAQWSVGLEAGYNKNYPFTNTGFRAFTEYKPMEGFNIGVPVKYTLNNWFGVQADPQFIRKSYQMVRSGFFDGVYQKNINNYIQLPLMAHFTFGGQKIKGFFNLGGYAGYWASSHIKGTQLDVFSQSYELPDDFQSKRYLDFKPGYNYDEKYEFDKRKDRRIELGLLTGAGISYQLKPRYELFAEGRYYRALTDQQKDYMLNQIPRYNDTFTIQVGCMYRLGK
ncbi:PorT family protein [Pedobacter sp. PAMC26386]|nr:PorT family protein [Pedobacter sp. PAMC26386]